MSPETREALVKVEAILARLISTVPNGDCRSQAVELWKELHDILAWSRPKGRGEMTPEVKALVEAAKQLTFWIRCEMGKGLKTHELSEALEKAIAAVEQAEQQVAQPDFTSFNRTVSINGQQVSREQAEALFTNLREQPPAATVAEPVKSLLREPVKLVVTRDGVVCEDQAAALEEFKERCKLSAEPAPQTAPVERPPERLKMFVWTNHGSYIAVAHDKSVAAARVRLLEEIGAGNDGSCPEREAAYKHVKENSPEIWHGPNAEFALTDSAELREQELFSQTKEKEVAELSSQLAAAQAHDTGMRERLSTLIAQGKVLGGGGFWRGNGGILDGVERMVDAMRSGTFADGYAKAIEDFRALCSRLYNTTGAELIDELYTLQPRAATAAPTTSETMGGDDDLHV